MFIGEQGTGKSTVAKIISTFLWLEMAFARGDYDGFASSDFRTLCKNQLLDECFKDSTDIEYEGEAFCFKYSEGKFSVSKNKKADYHRPKIIYVPSERNLLSIVEKFLDS